MEPNSLTSSFPQYGFNMDEVISRSKVATSFKNSCREIQTAQNVELQKISDIVTNENENLMELNRKCEKYNVRNEYKLQIALESQKSLIGDMIQVTDSFRKLQTVIEELDAFKTTTEQRNSEINVLFKTVNDIQHVEIPETEHRLRVLNENIHNVQSNIKCDMVEKEVLDSKQTKMFADVTGLEEILVKLGNSLENMEQGFMLESNKNTKLIEKRDKLQNCIEQNTAILNEMNQTLHNLLSESLAKMKMDLENEVENGNLMKTNVTKKIASERADDDLQLEKLNEQWDATKNNLRFQIDHYKYKLDEIHGTYKLRINKRIEEQNLMMDKTRRIEALEKRKLELTVLLQQRKIEIEIEKRDVKHQTKELKMHKAADQEAGLTLVDKKPESRRKARSQITAREKYIKKISLQHNSQLAARDVDYDAILASSDSQTSAKENTVQKSLSGRLVLQIKQTSDSHSTDGMSFLSNVSFGSEMNDSMRSQFKLPQNFLQPLALRKKVVKSAGIPKPKPVAEN